MTNRAKIITTILLLLVLTGVGAADYYLAGREYAADLIAQNPDATDEEGVAKAGGADVEAIMSSMNVVTQPSEDLTFLSQVSQDNVVHSFVLLQDGDRIGSVSWIDGDAKESFISLKEALLSAFSSEVEQLSDKTLQEENRPVRNVLTFRDPALSEETLTFIRVRERLYEFHSAQGKETAVQQAIDALTR